MDDTTESSAGEHGNADGSPAIEALSLGPDTNVQGRRRAMSSVSHAPKESRRPRPLSMVEVPLETARAAAAGEELPGQSLPSLRLDDYTQKFNELEEERAILYRELIGCMEKTNETCAAIFQLNSKVTGIIDELASEVAERGINEAEMWDHGEPPIELPSGSDGD